MPDIINSTDVLANNPKSTRRTIILLYTLTLLAIVLFTLSPMICVLLSNFIASYGHCSVDEAGIQPCVIYGVDMGRTLSYMGMMGWLMLVTLPSGLYSLAGWFIALVIHLIVFCKRCITKRLA